MPREALEYMLQMFGVQLMELLNAACKVVDNRYTFLQGYRFNILLYNLNKCNDLQSFGST